MRLQASEHLKSCAQDDDGCACSHKETLRNEDAA